MAELALNQKRGTKRWNVVGSRHAQERMAQLREKKLKYRLNELIEQWAVKFGRPRKEWWPQAMAAGLTYGCGTQACIDFLSAALKAGAARSADSINQHAKHVAEAAEGARAAAAKCKAIREALVAKHG